jgi:CheY-like chemotaxis protein
MGPVSRRGRRIRRRDLEADASRAVPWRVEGPRPPAPEREFIAGLVEAIDRRRCRVDPESEHLPHGDRLLVEKQIVAVEADRHAEGALRRGDTGDVIDVRMGQQNPADVNRAIGDETEEAVDLVARIDDDAFTRLGTRHDEPVLEERTDCLRLDYDHAVILAILDDLMFTSKIRTTAKQLGVPLAFARSSAAALQAMTAEMPSLVILDLNNPRTDPLGVIAKMKADPALAQIPTVGFASHVDVDTITAARQAGVGSVMARSAFFERLPDLLGTAG